MEPLYALEPVILLLAVGILAILLMRPLRLSPIVGYLIAGMLIGPHGLGLIPEGETTRLLAELGVVFLMFDIGLHFSLRHVWDARQDILGLGPLQVGLCGLAFGLLAAAAGLGAGPAIVVGATLALSSTAVVVQTLSERGQQSCPVGLTATAVLVFQDVAAIFLLILAASLDGAGGGLGAAIGAAALKAALAFGAAILIGRFAINPLFDLLSRTRQDEIFTATALLIVLAAAAATGALGLSLTLGAFLGGMIIAETLYRPVIQTEVRPFRGLLLGFFFITVGMSLDPDVLLREWASMLLVLAGLIAIKALLVAVTALAFRWSIPGSVQLGLLLAQGSEFAFVIFAMPAVRDALGEPASAILITAVAASLALTPSLAGLGRTLAGQIRQRLAAAQPVSETTRRETVAPVVVFGMDAAGRSVADGLEAHGIAYEAIEMDHDRFVTANADGYPVLFGDAGDPRLMETLAMQERAAIVVTIVRYEVSAALTPIMRNRYPNLARFVGVDSEEERARFAALGMRAVVNRSVPRGLELAAAVLAAQGVDAEKIDAWMRRQQDRALQGLAREAAPSRAA